MSSDSLWMKICDSTLSFWRKSREQRFLDILHYNWLKQKNRFNFGHSIQPMCIRVNIMHSDTAVVLVALGKAQIVGVVIVDEIPIMIYFQWSSILMIFQHVCGPQLSIANECSTVIPFVQSWHIPITYPCSQDHSSKQSERCEKVQIEPK